LPDDLQETPQRFHAILDATLNGILAIDSLGTVIVANRVVEELLGMDRLKSGFSGISGGLGSLVFGLRKYALGRPPARKPFYRGSY
jgi:hypothetical protein